MSLMQLAPTRAQDVPDAVAAWSELARGQQVQSDRCCALTNGLTSVLLPLTGAQGVPGSRGGTVQWAAWCDVRMALLS